ncbi:ANTAR domain-containing protein [Streptomyces sp. NPDC059785]|uniref:ANTAR domain-containing protein n=1 Tax=Streptomyces sp. NPDC059785 TaxID=3346945 RepID=UPI0036642E93
MRTGPADLEVLPVSTTERESLIAEAVPDLAARTCDCDVLDLLHDLTAHMVTLLGVRAAGTTVLNEAGEVDFLTASDETCRELEEDRLELNEGPCVDSARSGTVLAPVALRGPGPGPRRRPRFTVRALRAGILGVAAVPLRAGEHTLGTVNLLSATPDGPTERDLRLAQVLADAAGAWLRQRQVLRTKDGILGQAEAAPDSRIVIEQAKGVLAARLGISVEESFARLRAHARAQQQRLGDLATSVARGTVPPALATAL